MYGKLIHGITLSGGFYPFWCGNYKDIIKTCGRVIFIENFQLSSNLNYNVENLFVHNPPKLVLNSLRTEFGDDIEYLKSEYAKISVDILKGIFRDLNENILGQEQCKKQLITGFYRLTKEKSEKPAVFMLYGPSGVGKTETAKIISRSLGGELLRIQFSMMQTQEAYNYLNP